MSDSKALAVTGSTSNVELYRASTDAANLCKSIVVETAKMIGDRKYVQVEGWQAIAVAHGCTASARNVEAIEGGVRAIGEIRRMSDGAIIAEAEGFVGEDEPVWYGGTETKTGRNGTYTKTYPKRAMYAIRAMAQTRAISRACRSAFAHVVVMMNAGLSTTPAEEVPDGGFVDTDFTPVPDKKGATNKQQASQQQGVTDDDAKEAFMTMIEELACQQTSISDLDELYGKNNAELKQRLTPPEYKRVISKFTARREVLLATANANPFEDAA